ncbi:MAG TPA: bifunctional nuclease family protein [Acidimicrobiales bacterium]|nr:bifunctional nuclease family protein [Acidimicrobiales bacterium]
MSEEQSASNDEVTEPSVPEVPDAEAEEIEDDSATFNVMSVESVLYDLSDSSPMVHLIEEATPYRYLAIPIALTEAVALHHALDKIDGRRPGTHELAAEVLRRLNADVVAARITRYDGGVFYAELELMTPRGREVFDCRTSDALILATRQGVRAPVLCAESVLQTFYL